MNLEAIPKAFWYAISLSLLISTSGLTYIAYKAETFTLKYKEVEFFSDGNMNFKAQLEKQAENLQEQERTLAQREAEIQKLETLAEERYADLEEAKTQLNSLTEQVENCEAAKTAIAKTKRQLANDLESEREKKRKASEAKTVLEELKSQQKQQVYQQQQQQQVIKSQQRQQNQIQQQIQQRY